MSYTEDDIIYEADNFWVLKVKNGFEVLQNTITHSIRVAQIGVKGERGKNMAIIECEKRQAIFDQSSTST